jgi:hypothetical protein
MTILWQSYAFGPNIQKGFVIKSYLEEIFPKKWLDSHTNLKLIFATKQ